MKVGILTYHRAENYGALLQAYALMTYLRQSGHDVSFVDYWPQYHVDHYHIFSWQHFKSRNIKGKFFYILWFILWGRVLYSKKRKLTRFMNKRLGVPSRIRYKNQDDVCSEYDVVIYGSDQIWRKQEFDSFTGFNPWYFGSENINAPLKIAYAASMGRVDDITATEMEQLQSLWSNFNRISVREKDLQQLVLSAGYQADLVLDPVFLLPKEEWEKIIPQTKKDTPYILYYNLLSSCESDAFVSILKERTGLPVKEISFIYDKNHSERGYIHDASIESFLNLIDNAALVVSNSFHGLAFSIIFKKNFFVSGLNDKSSRITSLLDVLGLEERLVSSENYNEDSFKPIDYSVVTPKLTKLVEYSKSFLSAIDECK